jgi:putative transposase
MARMARLVQQGYPYHVTHRGNRRAEIFSSDADRNRYLNLLKAYAERFGLDIWAYCLMPNHVHLIVRPRRADAMALTLGNAHRAYSRLVNERSGWTGHLWAGRYFSTLLDEEHLWAAVRYVELNPVRAGLALLATDFAWSSARAHAFLERDGLLAAERPFPGAIHDWSEWLQQGVDDPTCERLRANTSTGRPSVGPQLLEWLERSHGRALHPGRRGRHAVEIAREEA